MNKLKCSGNFSEPSHIFMSLRKLVHGTWQTWIITNITMVKHIEEFPSLQLIIKIQLKYDCIVFTAQWKEESWWPPEDASFTHLPEFFFYMNNAGKWHLIYAEKIWMCICLIHIPRQKLSLLVIFGPFRRSIWWELISEQSQSRIASKMKRDWYKVDINDIF